MIFWTVWASHVQGGCAAMALGFLLTILGFTAFIVLAYLFS